MSTACWEKEHVARRLSASRAWQSRRRREALNTLYGKANAEAHAMSEPHYVAQAPPRQAGGTLVLTKQAAPRERERETAHTRVHVHTVSRPQRIDSAQWLVAHPAPLPPGSTRASPCRAGCSHCARGTGYRDLAQWRRDQARPVSAMPTAVRHPVPPAAAAAFRRPPPQAALRRLS